VVREVRGAAARRAVDRARRTQGPTRRLSRCDADRPGSAPTGAGPGRCRPDALSS
jgi:hypothetical protein